MCLTSAIHHALNTCLSILTQDKPKKKKYIRLLKNKDYYVIQFKILKLFSVNV